MRAKGLFFLILGIVLVGLSWFILHSHDVIGILGALMLACGTASVATSLVYFLTKEPRMQ